MTIEFDDVEVPQAWSIASLPYFWTANKAPPITKKIIQVRQPQQENGTFAAIPIPPLQFMQKTQNTPHRQNTKRIPMSAM